MPSCVFHDYDHFVERWTSTEVLAAARMVEQSWPQPADMEVFESEDVLAIRVPVHLTSPTSGRVQAWIHSRREFAEIRPEMEHVAREWGVDEVWWWVDTADDVAVEAALRDCGADLVVTELLLARSLEGAAAETWLVGGKTPGMKVSIVDDQGSFGALTEVETAGWGRNRPSSEALSEEWERIRGDLASSSAFALVATVDGIAASVGRCGLFGPVVRLFGAVTLPEYRGRGLYGEVVAARCRLGKEHGATLAMTKGRPDTSAPILRRAGFLPFQTERCWRLRVEGVV